MAQADGKDASFWKLSSYSFLWSLANISILLYLLMQHALQLCPCVAKRLEYTIVELRILAQFAPFCAPDMQTVALAKYGLALLQRDPFHVSNLQTISLSREPLPI